MSSYTGQRAFPLLAESETSFFRKVVDAQVEFVKDQTGVVTHAIMHQGGRDQKVLPGENAMSDAGQIR
jgi:hypothetical protein